MYVKFSLIICSQQNYQGSYYFTQPFVGAAYFHIAHRLHAGQLLVEEVCEHDMFDKLELHYNAYLSNISWILESLFFNIVLYVDVTESLYLQKHQIPI